MKRRGGALPLSGGDTEEHSKHARAEGMCAPGAEASGPGPGVGSYHIGLAADDGDPAEVLTLPASMQDAAGLTAPGGVPESGRESDHEGRGRLDDLAAYPVAATPAVRLLLEELTSLALEKRGPDCADDAAPATADASLDGLPPAAAAPLAAFGDAPVVPHAVVMGQEEAEAVDATGLPPAPLASSPQGKGAKRPRYSPAQRAKLLELLELCSGNLTVCVRMAQECDGYSTLTRSSLKYWMKEKV